jgi:putative ABC transport system ATP-binding protein
MVVFDKLWEAGNTIILVTHEADIAGHSHRQVHMLDGKIESDTRTGRRAVEPATT